MFHFTMRDLKSSNYSNASGKLAHGRVRGARLP